MKQCKKCGKILPIEEFHMRTEGCRRGACRECMNAYVRSIKGKPDQRERTKQYRLNNRLMFNKHNAAYRKAHREECTMALRERRRANPLMNRAHLAVNRAIKKGLLVRLPCHVCGKTPTHGHHEDYSKPLDVIWLCHKHHKAVHVNPNMPRD